LEGMGSMGNQNIDILHLGPGKEGKEYFLGLGLALGQTGHYCLSGVLCDFTLLFLR
jgi:hypothetical protein